MSVSVVIPCFDQGHFLGEAIESALRQSHLPERIIVVDDGSRDETPSVARRYGEAITYVRQTNAGLSAARNRGIALAESEFVHFLDADDMLEAAALERLVGAARSIPDSCVVRGSWREIDEQGDWTESVSTPPLGADPFHALFDPMTVGPPCRHLVRRELLLQVGLFDTNLGSCEDWDLWLRLALAGGTFVDCPDALAVYRRHGEAMSRNHQRMWRSGLAVLDRARARHGCARCREAHAAGVATWREYCYVSMLRADINDALHSRRLLRALNTTARAVRTDPRVLRPLGKSVIRNMQGAIRGT